MTLVAELSGEVVGFIDARLEQSPDAMHREMTYCVIAEIAVRRGHRSQGIGGRLLRAAEDWGRQLRCLLAGARRISESVARRVLCSNCALSPAPQRACRSGRDSQLFSCGGGTPHTRGDSSSQ